MSWNQSPVIGGGSLTTIKDSLTTLTDGLKALLELAKANAEIAKILAQAPNPLFVTISASCDAIIADLETLRSSAGFSSIICHPWVDGIVARYDKATGLLKLPVTENINYVDRAFDDVEDLQRPTGTGSYGGLAFMIASPDIAGFKQAIEKLGNFFSSDKIKELLARILKVESDKSLIDVELGREIDFVGITQASMFPELDEALLVGIGAVEGIKSLAAAGEKASEIIIEGIDAQIAEFTRLTDLWVSAINKLSLSLDDNGLYWRFWNAENDGIATMRTDLINSSQWPTAWGTAKYSLFFGMFASNAPMSILKILLGI